jgi:hypothetical protein
MAFPFTITEVNGLKRSLILRGRSLPYKGAVLDTGSQRVEITYFPGNPVAFSQVLGPTYDRSEITGKWKDKFLADEENAPIILGFPMLSAAGRPTPVGANRVVGASFLSGGAFTGQQTLQLAKSVQDAIGLMRKAGALMRVEWMSFVRYGHLTKAEFPESDGDEVEWRIEFAWTGDTDVQPKASVVDWSSKSLLQKLLDFTGQLNNILAGLLYTAQLTLAPFTNAVADLLTDLDRLVKTLGKFASFQLVPAEVGIGLKASFYRLRDSTLGLLADIDSRDGRLEGARRFDNPAMQLSDLAVRQLRQLLAVIAEQIAEELKRLEAVLSRETRETYRVTSFKTLRDVSLEVYGTKDNWRQIASFNGLASSIVGPNTELRIPKL